jgi:hypothetical protein
VNGFKWNLFSTPLTLDTSSKFTGKDDMFLILNDFSTYSFYIKLPKFINPSSIDTVTSGLTPTPFNATDTSV